MILFLKFLVALLIFFTPFSFAATEPWAFSVLQGLVVLAWFLFLVTGRTILYPSLCKPVCYVFGTLIGIALLQSCFPRTLLDGTVWYPVTLMRLYTLEHLSLFVTYFAVSMLIIQIFQSQRDVKQLGWMLIVCATLVALCALVFPKGQYIALLTGITTFKEAIGPFVNRNHAGIFFAMNAIVLLGFFFTRYLNSKQMDCVAQKHKFVLQQIVLAIIEAGLLAATVFTRSRGALLALLMGLFGYAFLCIWCIPNKVKRKLRGFFYVFVLLVLSIGWAYTHVENINQFAHRSTEQDVSVQTRAMMYRSAQHILKQYPIWGIGIGALPVVLPSYTEWSVNKYIERLHSDWLEITVGMGYAGVGLLFLGLFGFVIQALKRIKKLETRKQFLYISFLSALLTMAVGSLVDFHFFIPGCALVFFLVLGLVMAPTFHKGHIHAIHLSLGLKIVVLLVLLGATWIPTQKTRCWRQFRFGKGLKPDGEIAAYQRGLNYYPGPRYALRLGNTYYNTALHATQSAEKQAYFAQAEQLAQTYLEKYPKDKELSRLYIHAYRQLH